MSNMQRSAMIQIRYADWPIDNTRPIEGRDRRDAHIGLKLIFCMVWSQVRPSSSRSFGAGREGLTMSAPTTAAVSNTRVLVVTLSSVMLLRVMRFQILPYGRHHEVP